MLTEHRSDPDRDLSPELPGRISPSTAGHGVYGECVSSWRSALVAGVGLMAISVAPAVAAPPGDDNSPPAEDLHGYPIAAGQDEGD
jgi:hypothetical protein